MQINRRDTLKAFFSGLAATSLPSVAAAYPVVVQGVPRSFTLDNGFRTHYIANDSGYVAATLVLRSKHIVHDGLAHLCEHTSFVGAAGSMSAQEVADAHKSYIQEGNATTEAGALRWYASFLPQYLPNVIDLLAAISLDQKFDLKTVAAQARVVLEELYLDKYSPDKLAQCKLERELFGSSHPYAKDTMAEEVARCKIPTEKLAAQMQAFANAVRLPANMDLFIVGTIEPATLEKEVKEHFGRYAHAAGPLLDVPRVGPTRAYRGLTEASFELQRPMTELRIAWSTGACLKSEDAKVLLALSEYLGTALFDELRDKDGDTYTPEVDYEPDLCSGIFRIGVSTSKDPQVVEKKIFAVIDRIKAGIDAKELSRMRDRLALKRCKEAKQNETFLDCMMERTLNGASLHDLPVESVTREEMLAAARKYFPAHRQAYVRLALKGQ